MGMLVKWRATGEALASRLFPRAASATAFVAQQGEFEQALLTREQQLAEAQRLARIGSWNWDLNSDTITWSEQLYRIYGVSKADFDVTPDACRALIHKDDLDTLRRFVDESRRTGEPFDVEHRIVLPSGAVKTVTARGFVEKDDSGRVVRMFGTEQDITEAKHAQTALREAEERYRLVVELCPDAILVQQDGLFTFANQAATVLLGAANVSQIVGKSIHRFSDPHSLGTPCKVMTAIQRGEPVPRTEEKFVRQDGSEVDVEIHASSFTYGGKDAVLFIVRDITERKRSAEQMAYLAHYDSLTDLPNRTLFHQRLAHALNIAERPGRSLEVLFLDLDHFKEINDTLGHAAGDLVLKETAERLQGILRESDTVARLGGDEFVVLVENVDEPHRGGTIAEKILAALAPPYMRDDEPLHITASIGISSFPTDGIDANMLLKKADAAMYRAKEAGRNSYRYYSARMNRHSMARLTLEDALDHALEKQQIMLHYQPTMDVASHRIAGMEALLRWRHPSLGWIAPAKFIPLAEESGMIEAIGIWAIRTACMQNKLWQAATAEPLRVAVNLSPLQLADRNFISGIRRILEETRLAADCLELEIAESALIRYPGKAVPMLDQLREIGVGVTIDDFGTGLCSFAHLKQLPIRAVKIDRSFVQGCLRNRGDAAITKAIIGLAHDLGCNVTAVGTETRQQFEFLRDHECNRVQGYYFSKPLNADRFAQLLHAKAGCDLQMH